VEVVTGSGLGTLDPVQLDTLLSAKSVELYPGLDATTETFSGTSTTNDVETMLQVVASYLQQPRFDQAALDSTIDSWRPYVDDPNGDPDLAVFAKYTELRYPGEPRYAAMPTAADLDALDLPTVERVWRDRFSSPSDWVFAISGDFDLDEMTDLVRRYIGSLPAGDRPAEVANDLQPSPPDGIADAEIKVGTGQKATLTRLYEAPIDVVDLPRELVLADLVSGVISNRLTDRVREQLGASYSPYGYATVYTDPDLLVETYINVTGDPDQIDELTRVLNAELVDLGTNGPTANEFDDALAAVEQSYDLFDNDTLAQLLIDAIIDDNALSVFIDRRDTLAELDLGDVRSALSRLLPVDHYIQLRQLPV
jgi:zinc protease